MDKQKNMDKQNEQVINRAGLMKDCIMQINSVEIIEEK